ncbi:MAG: D-inositol-3-phosphate glycosyltransferase [Anaerolineae bacterium]|nr:D-inositol-3-phosphate glycosyltransferase [Anaerolineae bacterium]
MKIAFIYDVVYPYVKGGAERRYYELAKRLKGDYEIHLWGMKFWEGPDVIQTEEGVILHGVCPPMPLYVNGRRSIKQAIYYALRLIRPLLKENYDLIECPSAPFFPIFTCKLYSLLKRRRLVVVWLEYWGDYWYEYLGKLGGIARFIEKIAGKLPDHIIAISDHTRDALIANGINGGNITSIPLGINLAEIEAVAPSPVQSDLIFVGRLIKEKNVDVLLYVIKELVDNGLNVKCCIVGDGPERVKLERLAQSLALTDRVAFLGFVEKSEDVYALLKSSKVFVFLSTREGFGLVVLEANACGLPVIVAQHEQNAAVSLVRDKETGFLCNLETKEIADCVHKLIIDDGVRYHMQQSAMQWAHYFDWNKTAERTEKQYQGLIEPR